MVQNLLILINSVSAHLIEFTPSVVVLLVFYIAQVIIVFIMFFDCLRREFRSDLERLIWILVLVFGQALAAVAYFFVIRRKYQTGVLKG